MSAMSASPLTPGQPHDVTPSGRLESWKEIAQYLARSERTVRRWERDEGLPVHRHVHNKRGTVFAWRSELDAWLAAREGEAGVEESTRPPAVRRQGILVLAALVAFTISSKFIGHPSAASGEPIQLSPLTALPGSEAYPAFSPDGKWLAYCWNGAQDDAAEFDIYVRPVDGQSPARRIHAPLGVNLSPAWSPDGRRIAWFRYESGWRGKILMAGLNGGPEMEVTTAAAPHWSYWAQHVAWSHDGRWLLFSDADSPDSSRAIYAVSIQSGHRRRLTNPPGAFGDESPALSPDGRTLAFVRKEAMHRGDVYVVEISSSLEPRSPPRRTTAIGSNNLGIAWLPDSRSILFAASEGFRSALWRAIAGRPELTQRYSVDMEGPKLPAVSPAGNFAFVQQVGEVGIWSLPLGGDKVPPKALIPSTRHDGFPRLSLEGDQIVYMSNRTGQFEVWISNADGSSPRQITSIGAHSGYASWEPGGRRIVFTSNISGTYQLYVVGRDGGPPKALTQDAFDNVFPVWSRDGKWIYFSSNRNGVPNIFRIPANGGPVGQITRSGGVAVRETYDGQTLVFARDALLSTTLWTVPSQGGEEKSLADSQFGWTSWDVTPDGIVYLPFRKRGEEWWIEHRPFRGGPVQRLARLPSLYRLYGLSAGRDLRHLIVARLQHQRCDIIAANKIP